MPTPLPNKDRDAESNRIFWWVSLIAIAATSVLCGSFLLYWLYFGQSEISKTPADWGPFGDFIGGVTNPILSLFTLLSVLLTLLLQSKQVESARAELDRTRQAATEQMEHLRREAKKADIFRTIQVLEGRLEQLYREPIFFINNGQLEQWELYLLLSHATAEVLKRIPAISDIGPSEFRNEYLRTKGTLTQFHITLVKLSMQLTELVVLDDSEQFSFFYEPTISYMANKLEAIGYLPQSDVETIRYGNSFRNTVRQNRRRAA
jgi:uncharacterized membrane protein